MAIRSFFQGFFGDQLHCYYEATVAISDLLFFILLGERIKNNLRSGFRNSIEHFIAATHPSRTVLYSYCLPLRPLAEGDVHPAVHRASFGKIQAKAMSGYAKAAIPSLEGRIQGVVVL